MADGNRHAIKARQLGTRDIHEITIDPSSGLVRHFIGYGPIPGPCLRPQPVPVNAPT